MPIYTIEIEIPDGIGYLFTVESNTKRTAVNRAKREFEKKLGEDLPGDRMEGSEIIKVDGKIYGKLYTIN